MIIAKRVSKINPSFTLQMATKAADMRSRGIDVINFSVGEPDLLPQNTYGMLQKKHWMRDIQNILLGLGCLNLEKQFVKN